MKTIIFMSLLGLALAVGTAADTFFLQPEAEGKDATILSGYPDVNLGDYENLTVGRIIDSYGRILIEWDLSGLPPNQDILNATMSLYCSEIVEPCTETIMVYLVRESWQEMTVTWANQPAIDYGVYAYHPFPSTENTWVDIDVTDIVSGWNDGTYDNFGLLAIEDVDIGWAGFWSSDYGTVNRRPKLDIQYDPVGIASASLGGVKATFR